MSQCFVTCKKNLEPRLIIIIIKNIAHVSEMFVEKDNSLYKYMKFRLM